MIYDILTPSVSSPKKNWNEVKGYCTTENPEVPSNVDVNDRYRCSEVGTVYEVFITVPDKN